MGTVLLKFYHLWFWNKVVNYYMTIFGILLNFEKFEFKVIFIMK